MECRNNFNNQCDFCSIELEEPYIKCTDCIATLCPTCYSKGVDGYSHKNDHSYSVISTNFKIFEESNWSANEEYLLLKGLFESGFGNWEEVSKCVQTFSSAECEKHYLKYYFDGQFHETTDLNFTPSVSESLPFLYGNSNEEDPPRKLHCDLLAGYNSYRSDFEISFDNDIENSLVNVISDDAEDDTLMQNLQCACINAYNNKLRERQRRMKILSRHGLILPNKFSYWLLNFEETLGLQTCERLGVFLQFMSGMQFDAFVENLSIEKEMMLYMNRLNKLRAKGITSFKSFHLYQKLNDREENIFKKIKALDFDWDTAIKVPDIVKLKPPRKAPTPLEIIGLEGFETLNEKEKEICSDLRLTPAKYIEIMDLLMTEYTRKSSLKLLDARKIVRIDVNKTRKLYDYFMSDRRFKYC